MASKGKWRQIGNIDVDSGMVWIGDPCYVLPRDAKDNPGHNWGSFCETVGTKPFHAFTTDTFNVGVMSGTAYGDGTYPVFARIDPATMRVKELRIQFS